MKSKIIIISSCIAFFVLGLVFLPGIVNDLPFFEPIDFSQFKYTCCAGRRISENQEYAAYGEIYQVREGFEDAYIYVVICHRDEEGCMEFGCPMEGKRPIFYERVKKDEVINVMVDGEQKPFYLEMKWVDDDHIFIHDRVVDISEGYDYRNDTDS